MSRFGDHTLKQAILQDLENNYEASELSFAAFLAAVLEVLASLAEDASENE